MVVLKKCRNRMIALMRPSAFILSSVSSITAAMTTESSEVCRSMHTRSGSAPCYDSNHPQRGRSYRASIR
ncbi:hypothetical protein PF005_g9822 [Phytophthora fragariae]|uniref:Uncharacterized protein n=1 Tax=Phytophthora fragariae TaxID=53985 RepID=A0A6A3Y9D8_9STRA|nr:hypothetical protein PF003_g13718 [Phytophthora fragariae]KAE8939137.1 hypothetical protein PF009_g11010 [Phytophthora fragariae]KAE9007004.1 hypothetical protein PF011_g11324 [Phytophthora fragariae]KAE9110469.1 hypothetical protein PF007_g11853 [Phytophthora fragariae]KAE9114248.1 hypothetical protein PF010_g9776 [Phytophthora fragariae]